MNLSNFNINLESELNEALKKLTSSIYFDKSNLHLRGMLAQFLNQSEQQRQLELKSLEESIIDLSYKPIDTINLILMPKNVDEDVIPCLDLNFFTNKTQLNSSSVSRLAVFIDATIEVHLISVVWIMRYGAILDKSLDSHSFGNRLQLEENGSIPEGRRLFKKYESQFQNWWSLAIKATQHLLDNGKDATIINLDFKDYYHRIELDFKEVEAFIIKNNGVDISKDPLHKAFTAIHTEYRKKLIEHNHEGIRLTEESNECCLPIGLLSSSVLANFFLREFDSLLRKKLKPEYYGRYVDDIMIVLQDTVLNFKDDFECIDDEKKKTVVEYYFETYLSSIFKKMGAGKIGIELDNEVNKYENLIFQKDKLFIYQFDSKLSPNLLDKFEKEQKNRVSAFLFLSEDDDDLCQDLDEIVFEDNFNGEEASNGRFKALRDKKYELSVYLAKLIRGSVIVGNDFRVDQVDKVAKYFKGHNLIKSYYFWEKLLQLWFIREDYNQFLEIYAAITKEINELNSGKHENSTKNVIFNKVKLNSIKKALMQHLDYSLSMSLGLYPEFGERISTPTQSQKRLLDDFSDVNKVLFRNSGLLRKSCVHFPLSQFSKSTWLNSDMFPLFKMPFGNGHRIELDIDKIFPYRVKFYELALLEYFNTIDSHSDVTFTSNNENKYLNDDFIDSSKILQNAWDNFVVINKPKDEINLKKQYFKEFTWSKSSSKTKIDGLEELSIVVRNGGKSKEGKSRIAVVNKYVDLKQDEKSLEGNPKTSPERYEQFNKIWDQITKVANCDIFIMPEITLPWAFVNYYTTNSVAKQIGLITGLEHFRSGDLGFNLTYTCLPISVNGDKDAIPIFRLKNHYSHREEKWIYDKRMIVPRQHPYRYNLIKWRGFYFSEYNCFELANLNHRNLFYGRIDMLFSPLWNQDMH